MSPLAILGFFHFVPLTLAIAGALATGNGLRGAWGTPLLSLTGLLFAAWAPNLLTDVAIRRIVYGTAVIIIVLPLAYATSVLRWDLVGRYPPRAAWPQAEIAARFEHIWQQRTGRPLLLLAGDPWYAGMVAVHGSQQALLLNQGDLSISPLIDRQRLQRDGVMLIFGAGPTYPPPQLKWLTADRVDGVEHFTVRSGRRSIDLPIWWTIHAPGLPVGEPSAYRVVARPPAGPRQHLPPQ